MGTGFLLAQTIGTPITGKLSDICGRKVTFEATIVAFLVTSLLCGIAQSMVQLVAFRFLQGFAAAGLLALAFAIMGDLMSPIERARNQGYAAATFLLRLRVKRSECTDRGIWCKTWRPIRSCFGAAYELGAEAVAFSHTRTVHRNIDSRQARRTRSASRVTR